MLERRKEATDLLLFIILPSVKLTPLFHLQPVSVADRAETQPGCDFEEQSIAEADTKGSKCQDLRRLKKVSVLWKAFKLLNLSNSI